MSSAHIEQRIPDTMSGMRLDQALARLLPAFSRARLQQWIRAEQVRVNGALARSRYPVRGGDLVVVVTTPKAEVRSLPQDMEIDIVYQDDDILVLDKPAGLIVHPGAGNPDGTLVNALLHHFPDAAQLPRAGIVHRLDKDTTGLMVVARSTHAHTSLVRQLQERSMGRCYLALVAGEPISGGTVDQPVGRHPVHRQRQAVVAGGKPAITHYSVVSRLQGLSLLSLRLESGRTHQIRVHMEHIGLPLIGDPVYAGRLRLPRGLPATLRTVLLAFGRQALHACRLTLRHPRTEQILSWDSALPADMAELIQLLRTPETGD